MSFSNVYRTVITLSRENKELNDTNAALRKQLIELASKVRSRLIFCFKKCTVLVVVSPPVSLLYTTLLTKQYPNVVNMQSIMPVAPSLNASANNHANSEAVAAANTAAEATAAMGAQQQPAAAASAQVPLAPAAAFPAGMFFFPQAGQWATAAAVANPAFQQHQQQHQSVEQQQAQQVVAQAQIAQAVQQQQQQEAEQAAFQQQQEQAAAEQPVPQQQGQEQAAPEQPPAVLEQVDL